MTQAWAVNADIIERPLTRFLFQIVGKSKIWDGLDQTTVAVLLITAGVITASGLAFYTYRLGNAGGDGFSARRVFWAIRKPLVVIFGLVTIWSVLIATR